MAAPEWSSLSSDTKFSGSGSFVTVAVASAVSKDVGDLSLRCGSGEGASQGKPRWPPQHPYLLKGRLKHMYEQLGAEAGRRARYTGPALGVLDSCGLGLQADW